jgi:hypothetical protein
MNGHGVGKQVIGAITIEQRASSGSYRFYARVIGRAAENTMAE